MWQALSLRHKLIALVLAVLLCTGIGLVSVVTVAAERERDQEAVTSARSLAAVIDKALRFAMLSGDRKIVRIAVSSLAKHRDVVNLAVLNYSGQVAARAGVDTGPGATLDRLVQQARRSGAAAGAKLGDARYAIVSPILAEPACARCHGPVNRLGYVSATVSTAASARRIEAMRNRLLWGGLLLLAATCASIYVAVSHWVERHLLKLTREVDALRGRDSGSDGASGPGDEVARLAASVTAMVAEINEKTSALLATERDLLRSQRLASIGLLAAGVAHEIGGPLSTIRLRAGFWSERTEGPAREAAAAVEEAAGRIGELQRELLSFDRREVLERAERDLGVLLRGCLDSLDLAALTVHFTVPPRPLLVMADASLLGRALENVLTNAAQAMQGQGTLTVTLRARPEGAAEIAIHDTGPGISTEDLPRIFEPFFTHKRGSGGSGLGLAIAREIIVRHGGDIVAATDCQGACFRIVLPLSPRERKSGTHLDS